MVKENLNLQLEMFLKVNMKKEEKKATVLLNLKVVRFLKVFGKMIEQMDKEN